MSTVCENDANVVVTISFVTFSSNAEDDDTRAYAELLQERLDSN